VKIGIIADGSAESQALRLLTRQIRIEGTQILDPIYADMQPTSTPRQIAKSAEEGIKYLKRKQAARVIVLVDREDLKGSPSDLATSLETAFREKGHSHICVVIKNRKFENWLIADPQAFKKMPARYKVTLAFEKAVVPDKADSVEDAEAHINRIVKGKDKYHKRRDAVQITAKQDCLEIGQNSRSFRRFLRLVGHPDYEDQSCKSKPKS
jgi:hypothetical protein